MGVLQERRYNTRIGKRTPLACTVRPLAERLLKRCKGWRLPTSLVSAKGAPFTFSLGQRPRIREIKMASAESAIHFRSVETRFQRLFTWRFRLLGGLGRQPG